MLPRALPLLAAALLAAGIVAAASGAQEPEAEAARAATARADASVAVDAQGRAVRARSSGDGADSATGGVDRDGVTVASGDAAARSATTGLEASASASAVARTVSVAGGLVRAATVRREVSADDGGRTYAGAVSGLRIGDRRIGTVTGPQDFDLPDGTGTATVNSGRAGLLVALSDGTEIAVATVSATARDGTAAAPTATPTPDATRNSGKEKAERAKRRAKRRKKGPDHVKRLSRGDFAFPVAGEARTADDFGGPRQIGAHQGNDIFAAFGTPVVAVADGTLEKVGTLPISGNRLWLRTKGDDTFFYAHMANFSLAARNGARVEKGTILGFTGNTGDAEPTPPHVHFEIHPRDGRAIDPHAILAAWQERSPLADADTDERPGTLIEVRDYLAE